MMGVSTRALHASRREQYSCLGYENEHKNRFGMQGPDEEKVHTKQNVQSLSQNMTLSLPLHKAVR
jgi:hypothetical protein